MFDNLTRYFSRRGTDKTDIATSSAAIADIDTFDDEPKEYVEQDIDAVSLDAPALDDLIISDESTILDNDIVSDDMISSYGEEDDFQEI